jgi:hypothetical protein
VARLCLALLRNLKHSYIVVEKSVRNFDVVSYLKGETVKFLLFSYRVSASNGSYLHSPKSPLKREIYGKTMPYRVDIRHKLGLSESDTNLSIFLRDMLEK